MQPIRAPMRWTDAPDARSNRGMVPAASILIVCFNSRAHFPRLKASLDAQTAPYALFVLDNASEADQRPRAEDFPAHAQIIQSEINLGFATANNRLVEMALTDLVVLLNPDAFPAPDWLERLLDAATHYPEVAAFGSTQIMANDETRWDGLGDCLHVLGPSWRGGHGVARDGLPAREGESFSVCAAAALYRRAAWRAIGGFDESFFCFSEDLDLGFRLRLAGWRCMQIAAAQVRHVGGASAGSDFSTYHSARNGLWAYAKNMPAALYWPLLPAHLALVATFYLRSFARADGEAYRRGARDGLAALPRIWRTRGAIKRQVRSRDIARLLSCSLSAIVERRAKIIPR
jgi:N-acetylglucosaminyl-diphospho-decaprenol L-rhamnosyltransferase